jgi:hypothetical protein
VGRVGAFWYSLKFQRHPWQASDCPVNAIRFNGLRMTATKKLFSMTTGKNWRGKKIGASAKFAAHKSGEKT